ncbi:MAG: 50S ribosomal protein L24 [Proteobacteria bacterium]|nr:50S ribosomal protein L24 [Pseudomonadota bacterium]
MIKKFKSGDFVTVISGDQKGKQGSILKIDRNALKVLVDGVNIKRKRLKKVNNASGERYTYTESFIHISNISHIDEKGNLSKKRPHNSNSLISGKIVNKEKQMDSVAEEIDTSIQEEAQIKDANVDK